MNKIEMKQCSICEDVIDIRYTEEGVPYWTEGHNAQPINNGRCCSNCNDTVVMAVRLKMAFMNSNEPLHARDINNLVGALLKAKGVLEDE